MKPEKQIPISNAIPSANGPPDRIGLTLSGGGFRATLFHLGVIRFLFETGLLQRVKFIGGVSGGSILAMHVGLHWDRYCNAAFDVAAREIVDFCQRDVRNRILRRWLFGWMTIFPRLVLGWSRIHLLVSTYMRLFGKKTLNDLFPTTQVSRPRIIAQSVSLSTGHPCSFGRSGFMWYELDEHGYLRETEKSRIAPHLSIALAVAASSAFPPMFPPVCITAQMLHVAESEFSKAQYITDGGIYDNLGIERPLWYYEQEKELDAFLVSDAGATFNWKFGPFGLALPRNVRATDLLMKRVGDLIYQRLSARRAHTMIHISIGDTTDSLTPGTLPPAVQRRVGGIRTDLDSFSNLEIDTLIRHGYEVTRKQLIDNGWIAETTPHSTWSPLPVPNLEAGPWAESLRKSGVSRIAPLFSLWDWPIWAAALAIAGLVLAKRLVS